VTDSDKREEGSLADPGLEALWQRVLDHWDDDKTHAALIEFALRTEQLSEAAGRYRKLKDDPAKAASAQKRLDAIVVAATQLMMSKKTPPRTKVPLSITLSAFGIFLFALCLVVYMVLHR
jgi:phage terminase large subunit-like protein